MVQFETLPLIQLQAENVKLRQASSLPELVHLDDPALTVMTDFALTPLYSIDPNESMDNALLEMKLKGAHLLLVIDINNQLKGLISSEDLLGEIPIKIIQQRRIQRSQVLVKMLMIPLEKITALDLEEVKRARVGNIVETLKVNCQHYALVVSMNEETGKQVLHGLFNTSQISKQLHRDIANSITKAQSVLELQKRNIK